VSASCTECRTLLGGYVLHALDADEDATVRRHLATCSACAAEHEQLAGVPAVLDAAGPVETPAEQPPAALEEAVLDRFAREHRSGGRATAGSAATGTAAAPGTAAASGAQGAAATTATPRRLRLLKRPRIDFRRPLPAAIAGAFAAAAVTAAVLVLPSNHGASAADSYQASLSGSPAAPGATARANLRVQASGTRVRLRVRGLRGTPDAVYELWCLRDDGAKVSAGTFRTDGSGRADVSLTTAAVPGEYHRLSIERKGFAPADSTSERVMAGEIEYPHS
jgi:hypothetical protein